MPNILELCNARLTRVPEEPVEPKITPSGHGTVKKKSSGESTGNAGGTKRSRPLDAGSGVADSSLENSPKYEKAKSAEKMGKCRQALELLRSLQEECPCALTKFDIERVIEAIYGVRGPLMSQTEPTHYRDMRPNSRLIIPN